MINKKKCILIVIGILLIMFLIFFLINMSKNNKIGKNSTSQEIVDNILNISSYEAILNVETKSNKNSNKYVLKQQYIKDQISTQEVIEPDNIRGIKIVKKDNYLKLENTKLNLTNILENYNYIGDNTLDLNSFLENYKEDSKSSYEEKNDEIVMKTRSNIESKYIKDKVLHIDRKTEKPTKMEIKDINQNTTIIILYKEVKINELKENSIVAFNFDNMKTQI